MTKRNTSFTGLLRGVSALLAAAMFASVSHAAKDESPAELKISGLGPIADREMRVSLERLLGKERGPILGANALEDAMFLLMSAVQDEGFLKPVIHMEVMAPNGTKSVLSLDSTMNVAIPRDARARRVHFSVQRGVRYFVGDLQIEGLHVLPVKNARAFFVGDSTLFGGKANRAYTPSRLTRGIESLTADLRQRGYAEAEVRADDPQVDEKSGEVRLRLEVKEKAHWMIADVQVDGGSEVGEDFGELRRLAGLSWSESAQQDAATEIRRRLVSRGYADVRVQMSHREKEAADGHKEVTVIATVRPGSQVTMGEVRFEGAGDVKEAVLRRRVHATPGEPLNQLEIDQARYRIARLGAFDRVEVGYEPADGRERSPVFRLVPGRRLEVNLLAGYGSYEQLRAGVEVRQNNLFGLAHQGRGLLVESMKSTRAEYAYTVPELFGESIDGTAKIFGLQREEVAFERQEYGGNVILSTPLRFLGANATVGYTFQALRNRNNRLETRSVDDKQVTVASVDGGLTRDHRDNPLQPRHGYRWFAQIEAASRGLGGEAEYQRSEFGGSYHTAWGNGHWLHLSAAHGVVTTWGTTDALLPVNKRFFPGGDGSIRSYRSGEASPRGPDGAFIGAKSYLSGSVEFEQALAQKWSAVVFADAVGTAVQLRHYPLDETLYAAGVGLRYQTLIGPIRVEYGHNLKRRTGDPSGTVLVSIGFPF